MFPISRAFILMFLLALGSCNTAKNLAANFVPTGSRDVEPSEIKSGTYVLDPEHAYLGFAFNHMDFSTTRVRFDKFEATLFYDKAEPGQTRLEVRLDPASVNSGVPEFDALLRGEDYFDVENFPEATFVSSEVTFTSEGRARVPGVLSLHGFSAPAVLEVTLTGAGSNWISGAYTLGFSARATVNRTDYGLDNLLALTGERVFIQIDAEFNRASE